MNGVPTGFEVTQATTDPHEVPSLQSLFAAFFRMGITAFGGPAMIPYVRKMAVGQRRWMDGPSFQDGVALCQTIPGATVMQMAAYIGLSVRGVRGAAVSYIGFILPAFLLMLILTHVYARTHELPTVVSLFSGLRTVVVAVVACATWSFGKTSLLNWRHALTALLAAVLFWFMVNPVLIIFLAASLGAVLNRSASSVASHSTSRFIRHTTTPLALLLLAGAAGYGLLFLLRAELFSLAVLMSKIDLIAFGGGFGSVPLMFHEIVEVRSWMDGPTFLNGIALGQFTPGPIVITATFVGYLMNGLPGALVATVAVFLPSFLIVVGVSPWFSRVRSIPWFSRALGGVLCSFVGLLLTVTIRFGLNVSWDWKHGLLALASLVALLLKVDILWVVLAGTALSVVAF